MTISQAPASGPAISDAATLDEATLEGFTGFYQVGEWHVVNVRREGRKLLMEHLDLPPIELRFTGERRFEMANSGVSVAFHPDTQAGSRSIRTRMNGADVTAVQVNGKAAEALKAKLAARIKAQKPLPGSEMAVRRFVEGLIAERPNYDAMHPALACSIRQRMPRLASIASFLGAIESIDFQGVGSQGWDVYDVQHERGTARVRILLGSERKLTGALFIAQNVPVLVGQ